MADVTMAQRFEALRAFNETESPQTAADIEAEVRHRERMFNIPAEFQNARFVTICSVWPERMVSQAFTHAGVGIRRYTIEAGSLNKPAYLLLENTFDLVIQQEGVGEVGHGVRTITAVSYGADIIKHWTGDHIANRVGKKGIGFIKGEYTGDPNNPVRATKAEVEELFQFQVDFLKFMVERADRNWDSGRPQDMAKAPTRENRRALEMLGLDVEQHAWYKNRTVRYNRCPRCATSMESVAFGCFKCGLDIPNYFTDLDLTPDPAEWPGVVKQMQLRAAAKAKKKTQ